MIAVLKLHASYLSIRRNSFRAVYGTVRVENVSWTKQIPIIMRVPVVYHMKRNDDCFLVEKLRYGAVRYGTRIHKKMESKMILCAEYGQFFY